MITNTALVGMVQRLALGVMLWVPALVVLGSEASITRTNWSDRWITNVIEVTMPVNHFVSESHTNCITRTVTNRFVVEAFETNFVVAYHTNWNMRTVTNPVTVEAVWTNSVVAYRTNCITKTQTNSVAVNVLRTNFVNRYHTNWSTLNLTNWETMVLFRTNRITQTLTNIVEVNLPSRLAAPVPRSEPLAPKEAPEEPALAATTASTWSGPLAIEATRTARPAANDLVEVQMRIRWTSRTTAPLRVQSWRIEREDGAVFLFGQDQDFKQQLPVGKYKVEARLKGEGDNPPLVARGTLSVTIHAAVIQQRLLVKK
jgi:hypothetical protein